MDSALIVIIIIVLLVFSLFIYSYLTSKERKIPKMTLPELQQYHNEVICNLNKANKVSDVKYNLSIFIKILQRINEIHYHKTELNEILNHLKIFESSLNVYEPIQKKNRKNTKEFIEEKNKTLQISELSDLIQTFDNFKNAVPSAHHYYPSHPPRFHNRF